MKILSARTTAGQLRSPIADAARGVAILFFLGFILLRAGCAPVTQRISFKEIVWEEINVDNTPAQEDYPNATAVFLLDEGDFSATKHSIFTRHVIIKILNEAGLRYANVEIPFYSETEVHNIKGRTIQRDGTIVTLQPEDVHEKSLFPEWVLYADSKAKVFAMPGAEVGSVMEYSYSMLYKRPFASAWEFQRYEPVLLSTFTLDIPDYLRYNYMLSKTKQVEVEKSVSHPLGRVKGEFKARNAPAITYEPFMPPRSEVITKIYFSLAALSWFGLTLPVEGDSWEILGDNYWYSANDKIKANRDIKSQVREIVKGATTEMEKIEKLYDFVQSEIRYAAIEIKEGRVVPHDPSEVFTNKYGDCKDKAFLLITMLKEAGIDALPVLARTRSSGEVIESFISFQQFDHMVITVSAEYFTDMKDFEKLVIRGDKDYTTSDDYVLLDATSRAVPFGQIPWYLEDTKALIIEEEGSRLVTIPSSSAGANKTIRECEAEIHQDGSFLCSVKTIRTGQEANGARSLLQRLSKTEQKEWFETSLTHVCPGAILKEHSISQLFDLSEPLILSYKFLVPQYAQDIDTFFVFCPSIFRNRMVGELTRETREHGITFDYCRTYIDGIYVKIPEGLKIKTLPDTLYKSSDFGDYSFSCFTDGERIVLNKQLSLRKTQIANEDYEHVKSFFEGISTSERRNVTLCRAH